MGTPGARGDAPPAARERGGAAREKQEQRRNVQVASRLQNAKQHGRPRAGLRGCAAARTVMQVAVMRSVLGAQLELRPAPSDASLYSRRGSTWAGCCCYSPRAPRRPARDGTCALPWRMRARSGRRRGGAFASPSSPQEEPNSTAAKSVHRGRHMHDRTASRTCIQSDEEQTCKR